MPCRVKSPPKSDWNNIFTCLLAKCREFLRNIPVCLKWFWRVNKKDLNRAKQRLREWMNHVERMKQNNVFNKCDEQSLKTFVDLRNVFLKFENIFETFSNSSKAIHQAANLTITLIFIDKKKPSYGYVYSYILEQMRQKNLQINEMVKRSAFYYAKDIIETLLRHHRMWYDCVNKTATRVCECIFNNGIVPSYDDIYEYFLEQVRLLQILVPTGYKTIAKNKVLSMLKQAEEKYSKWWDDNIYGKFQFESLAFFEYKPIRDAFKKLSELEIPVISINGSPKFRINPDKCDDYNDGFKMVSTYIVVGDRIYFNYLLQLIGRAYYFSHSSQCKCDHYIEGVMDAFHYYFSNAVVHEDAYRFYKSFYEQSTRTEFNWQKVKPVFYNNNEGTSSEEYPRITSKRSKKSLTVWNVIEIFTGLFDDVYDISLIKQLFGY
jgi:hypothetical protein